MKRTIFLMQLALALLLLTGCRVRTTAVSRATDAAVSQQVAGTSGSGGEGAEPFGSGENASGSDAESSALTIENPKAERREYDERASAEIAPGAEHRIHREGEENGAAADAEDGARVDRLSEDSARTARQIVPASEADKLGTDDAADTAATSLLYYTVLLQERLGSLFECQKKELYWEMPEAYRTIHKTSPEHLLILQAGCYDVSARLLEENLTVDAGWAQRKNPGVIVKLVKKSVLGFGAADTHAARAEYDALLSRPDWQGIDAVKNNRIVLLSEQMLSSQALRTAAALAIAKTAVPELFEDIDMQEALRSLLQEENGSMPEGQFIYWRENGRE